jgi:hypothetical protein
MFYMTEGANFRNFFARIGKNRTNDKRLFSLNLLPNNFSSRGLSLKASHTIVRRFFGEQFCKALLDSTST